MIAQFLGKMGGLRCQPQGYISPQGGIHPTLPVQTLPDQKTHSNKLLCRSSQEQLPVGGIASAVKQKCCRIGSKSPVPGLLQPVIPGSQTQQPVAPHLGSEQTQTFKMETPETIRTSLQTGEWVTSIVFKDAYFHVPINNQSRKYMRFHIQGKTYQFKALPFGLSTAPMEFTVIAKEVKWLAMRQGIRIHQYLDDWLVRVKSLQVCHQQTQSLVTLCKDLGWLVNEEKLSWNPNRFS